MKCLGSPKFYVMYFKKFSCLKQLIVILVLLIVCSCHQDNDIKEYKLSNEIKSLWDFMPGSYWIYKDSVSAQLDCVFVKDYNSYTQNYNPRRTYNGENAITETISYRLVFDSAFDISIVPQIDILRDPSSIKFEIVKSGFEGSSCRIFEFDEVRSVDFIDLGEISYNNVFLSIPRQFTFNQYCTFPVLEKFYLKEGIGLVKYRLSNNKVFELIRYNVTQ